MTAENRLKIWNLHRKIRLLKVQVIDETLPYDMGQMIFFLLLLLFIQVPVEG